MLAKRVETEETASLVLSEGDRIHLTSTSKAP